ncbi:radical SAM protein [Geoalkalibacter sp.]|uniref:radical SAM protein n=1 Tax=Geoalkalibacter sp. TaxID=3041440 RepID=UPI00272ECD97|nr:radical SAM protein [Geoalkalibacter sp.]
MTNQAAEEFSPAYLGLVNSGALAERARAALRHLENCALCPRGCHVNRLLSTRGAFCRTGEQARVYSQGPHHGEERPLSGQRGSGTIFFSHCNLGCVFCQNWEISRRGEGRDVSARRLADIMLGLQDLGCHNINLVTPSHVVPQILAALDLAAKQGLRLPLVFNSGGYDSPEALELLDGIIDIYMPDMKFADSRTAAPYLGVKDYAEVNRAAVREMHRQVGDLVLSAGGLARRGLLVRHLVLPGNLAGSETILEFLAREISRHTYLNLMDQYRPCYRADEYPPLDRRPTRAEWRAALEQARKLGLHRLDR